MNSASVGTLAKCLPHASDIKLRVFGQPDPYHAVAGETGSKCSDYRLRIAVVYQGTAGWEWASPAVAYAGGLVGNGFVESARWDIGQLNDFLAQAAAAQAAALADIVIVAIHDVRDLPASFYGWIFGALAFRSQGEGMLLLLGGGENCTGDAARFKRYLEALARTAKMEFLASEHGLRAGLPDQPLEQPYAQ